VDDKEASEAERLATMDLVVTVAGDVTDDGAVAADV
jgi:hypothetical protein